MPTVAQPATARLLGQTANVSFTASTGWGTRPSTITLVAPASAFDAVQGQVTDLQISCNGVTLLWRDVRVASIEASEPQNAGLWRVTLEDRRWKWQYGPIDGDYNLVAPPGGLEGIPGSVIRERTPRQLAGLLVVAMGEPALDVSVLPNDARPRKAWRGPYARDELDRLCADFGCVTAFNGPADAAKIVKIGQGAPIIDPAPHGGRINRSDGQAIPAWPARIRLAGGTVLFQTELLFYEAIGEDTDGSIKPINDLSYAPPGGWSTPAGTLMIGLFGTYQRDGQTLYVRDLAKKCIRKWYRVSGQHDIQNLLFPPWSPKALRGTPYESTSIHDLGPFLGTRVEKEARTGNRAPMIVRGDFYASKEEEIGSIAHNKVNTLWTASAKINNETKCLELEEEAFILESTDGFSWHAAPARLRVLCGYECSKDGVPVRYERFIDNDGPHHGAGDRIEHHDEIVREIIEVKGAGGSSDNKTQVDAEADFYLNAIKAEYEIRPTAQIELPLVKTFAPDGALRQIQWRGGVDDAPTTTLSYNAELASVYPDFRDTPQQRARREAEHAARQREAVQQGKIKFPGLAS